MRSRRPDRQFTLWRRPWGGAELHTLGAYTFLKASLSLPDVGAVCNIHFLLYALTPAIEQIAISGNAATSDTGLRCKLRKVGKSAMLNMSPERRVGISGRRPYSFRGHHNYNSYLSYSGSVNNPDKSTQSSQSAGGAT